jgi:hypothetical protein
MEATNTPAPRRNSRSTAARKAGRSATTKATPLDGSKIAATIERVWKEVQRFAAIVDITLPDVVCITGSGAMRTRAGVLTRLAHIRFDGWQLAEQEGRTHEIFVSGEAFSDGPILVLESVCHEAAHLVNYLAGVQDTARGNVVHNRKFVDAARIFGLDYQHAKPHPMFGLSDCTFTELGILAWIDTLEWLAAEIKAVCPTAAPLRKKTDEPGDPRYVPVDEPAEKKEAKPRRQAFGCGCGREIHVRPAELAEAPITCGRCGEDFGSR